MRNFDDGSLEVVRQGAVSFVIAIKDLIGVIGDEDARVNVRQKRRESKALSAPAGQRPATFNIPPSPDVSAAISPSSSGSLLAELSMDDILEEYEDAEYEGGVGGGSAEPSPPKEEPILQPLAESELGCRRKAPDTPLPPVADKKRDHRPSLKIRSNTPMSTKTPVQSPAVFEAPEMANIDNSLKKLTAILKSLLLALKQEEKEKYQPEADSLADATTDFVQEASRYLAAFELVLEQDIKASASHKVEFISSQISTIQLAAKLSSGVWPPATAKEDFEQKSFSLAKEIRILFGIVSAVHQRKGEYVKLREDLIKKQEEALREYREDSLLFERPEKEKKETKTTSRLEQKIRDLPAVTTLERFSKKVKHLSGSKVPLPTSAEPKEKPDLFKVHESIKEYVDQVVGNTEDIVTEEQQPPNPPIIKAGSLKKLVERLTYFYPDPDYASTFFMTYYRFTTGKELVLALIERFDIALPNMSRDQYFYLKHQVVTPIQLRVFNVLRTWLDKHFEEDVAEEDKADMFSIIEHFMKQKLQHDQPSLVPELTKSLQKKRSPEKDPKPKGYPVPIDPPGSMVPTILIGDLRVTEIDPSEMARQLCLSDHVKPSSSSSSSSFPV